MSRSEDFVRVVFQLELEKGRSATHTQLLQTLAQALLIKEGPREGTLGVLIELPIAILKGVPVEIEDVVRFMQELDFAVSHFDWTGKQYCTCLVKEAIDALVAN